MLKIQSDRVIIDGHEPTKEQCETMTLLANALAESESFKTVKYDSGYAEFEKIGNTNILNFVPAPPQDVTVIFDSHIISVNCPSSGNYGGGSWTTSGETVSGMYDVDLTYYVMLEDGYVIDTVVVSGTEAYTTPVISDDGKSFTGQLTAGDSVTVTITSKPATSRKSVDLTTLSGWSSLSSGSHSITIVAKADGYRDSEPSAAMTVTKAAPVYTDCITFTGESSDFTLAVGSGGAKEWDGTVEYSTDHNTWTVWDGTAVSSVDKKLYLRGSGNTKFYTSKGARFVLSARAACSGNIQTLLEYNNPPMTLSANNCYSNMFMGCTNLTTAPELPATTLANNCYSSMFYACRLTTAPELPATTLAKYCYQGMFMGCSLTTAPELPATTMEGGCYGSMFWGCSLTTAPELPATTLAYNCYDSMFRNCRSLTTAPELPATTLANNCYSDMFKDCTVFKVSSTRTGTYQYAWRIPTSGTASTQTGWNNNMLQNTGGTFTSNPSINTTYYVENEPVSVEKAAEEGYKVTFKKGDYSEADYYSTDNGVTWISCHDKFGTGVQFIVMAKQIKLKVQGDGSIAGQMSAKIDSTGANILSLLISCTSTDSDISSNYILTENITVTASGYWD